MNQAAPAPSLESGLGWLNTDRPLRIGQELAGHVVVLDFWTYCCINCMHILPDLAWLEHKYADEPVVFIGVHSAKFSNEADKANILAAILRYEIAHPVVIDDEMKIWRSYGVRSWPTLVVIDPEGNLYGAVGGEGNRDVIDQAIGELLKIHREKGTLAKTPLRVRREGLVRAASGLAFPGKVLADAAGKRIFIGDSNHNRVVVATWPDDNGRASLIKTVGDGEVGFKDGSAETARFNHPQGMALGRDKLYVADTENHAIRAANLSDWTVTTVVGTGRMSNDRAGGGKGTQQGLNSPWDLVLEGSTLYVAMAGTHQIWRIDLPIGLTRAFAGSGRENIVDGPTESAALAQPSGICTLGGTIYFADSEVSAIRAIDMSAERVTTLIGQGLFHFGDVDGPFEQAMLQHPLGVTAYHRLETGATDRLKTGATLLVADTYNHKIKEIDLKARTLRTRIGDGTSGTTTSDGAPRFFEPGGLSVAGDLLFVADTNNHRLVRIDLTTGAWHEVMIQGLEPPSRRRGDQGEVQRLEPADVHLAGDVELLLDITLPPAVHLNADAPWSVRIESDGALLWQTTGMGGELPLHLKLPRNLEPGSWNVRFSFAYCAEGKTAVCIPANMAWEIPVKNKPEGQSVIRATASSL